ncbi:traB domain-containing protein [Panicum miliaceum]|uniref:TraB domain-containing protein n=1 Tax=Panicum miliaceum TaxID=4540 RepID=A0A3L6T087_PANMI|nr:traB domain-containing protein [Panicum miliaceum]
MDPAAPAAPAPAAAADAEAEANGYEDAAEFEDAEAGGEGAEALATPASGDEEVTELPEELARGVVCLQCETSPEAAAAGAGGTCRVYVVGTAHVSQESCEQVKAVINYLKPQAVFLELCASRVAILAPQNLQVPTMNEMIDMWKKKKMNTFGILYSWFLAKVASQLEVLPGAEFRVAFEEAMSYGGKVILGDRPVQITLRRTWGKMSLWHRAKFLYYIIFQSIFLPSPEELNRMLKDMDDVDMLTLVIQEMSKAFPSLMETLLHERDMYMSSKLLKVAREHSSVVAVVGKGHVSGIKKNWQQPIQVKDLLELPVAEEGASKMKILASIGALSDEESMTAM